MSTEPGAVGIPRWLNQTAAISWRLLVIAGALYVAARVLNALHVVVLPLAAALFISTLLVPPARWLRSKRVPATLATWAVMLGASILIVGAILGVYPSIRDEFSQLRSQVNVGLDDIRHWLEGPPLRLSATQLDEYVSKITTGVDQYRDTLVKGAVVGVTTVIELLAALLLTFVLTFFFVKDGDKIGDWFVDLVARNHSDELRALGRRTWATLSGYVRGTAVNGFVNALVMTIGLVVIGVPLVVPIALLTFVGGFVPLAGAFVSGGVAALTALVAKGPLAATLVVILTIIIHQLEGYVVGPLVLGHAVKLHPIAVLLALTAGTVLAGILGAFVAVPITAVGATVVAYFRGEGTPEAARRAT